jgi:hypothetical protein
MIMTIGTMMDKSANGEALLFGDIVLSCVVEDDVVENNNEEEHGGEHVLEFPDSCVVIGKSSLYRMIPYDCPQHGASTGESVIPHTSIARSILELLE